VLPGARGVALVASSGRSLFDAFRVAPQASDGRPDPLDRFVRAAVGRALAALRSDGESAVALHYDEQRGGGYADFVELGRAAGLGWSSRLGLLLHPEHGPWISLRALLLSSQPLGPPSSPLEGSGPCHGCPAPCATACPGAVIEVAEPPAARSAAWSWAGSFAVERCAATRRSEPGCAERCAARRACPVGVASAYEAAAEAHHMRASALWLDRPEEESPQASGRESEPRL
jgi:hypothetical protein